MHLKEDFQTSNGFSYLQIKDVTLIAAPRVLSSGQSAEFLKNWAQFNAEVKPKICAFVKVGPSFQKLIASLGFRALKVGHEPWLNLHQALPAGNASKTARGARNQALRAGVTVEEWPAAAIAQSAEKQKALIELFQQSKQIHLLSTTEVFRHDFPLHRLEQSRFFIALNSQNKIQGYVVAKPEIETLDAAFSSQTSLENLVLDQKAVVGTGDLLLSEAVVALKNSVIETGLAEVSFGGMKIPQVTFSPLLFLATRLPGYLNRAHLNLKPSRWDPLYLSVKNKDSTPTRLTWLKVLFALFRASQPKINLNQRSILTPVKKSLRKHPLSWGFLIISFTLFALVNQFGELSEKVIQNVSFSASAPWWEWFHRSLISDVFFFNAGHFWFVGMLYFFALRWLEKTQRLRFTIPFILLIHLFDDFMNYFLIIKPFHYFEASLYHKFISYKDVGCSLCLMAVLGFQINLRARRHREFIFVLIILALLMGSLFTTLKFTSLVLNINHLVFMLLGYLVGKLKFEHMRRQSKLVAKNKPVSPR